MQIRKSKTVIFFIESILFTFNCFLHPRLHCRHFVCFVRANSIILSHLLMYKNPLKKCTILFLEKNCY